MPREPSSLELLVDCIPDWVAVDKYGEGILLFTAQATHASGSKGREYRLSLSLGYSEVEVREAEPSLLPRRCPQRHVQSDASFCLGWKAGSQVTDPGAAQQWWDKLRSFLLCQDTATATGYWPDYAELSHGVAGFYQMQGEEFAARLGKTEEFKAAMRGIGDVSNSVCRVKKDSSRLLNGRAACICLPLDERGRTRLRRDCQKAEDCLVIYEAMRRKAEKEFWDSQKGMTCCRTMATCPFNVDTQDRAKRYRKGP